MKKYTTFILMLSIALSLCASNDYASILERAMMSSSQIDTAYMNYQNGKLSARQAKLDDVTSYTVSADAGVVTADPDPDWYIRPTLTVVVPDDFDTTITASLGKTGANRSGKYRISHPSLTISMNFDLTGYDEDELADLSASLSSLSTEVTWQRAQLSFENQLISQLDTILSVEAAIRDYRHRLANYEKALSDSLEVNRISRESTSYSKQVNTIELTKNTIESLENQLDTAKKQYRILAGIDYEGLDSVPPPELEFSTLAVGSTSVIMSAIEAEIAEAKYRAKYNAVHPEYVSVSSSADTAYYSTLGVYDDYMQTSGSSSVFYNRGSWKLGATGTLSFDNKDSSFTPTLTVSGSWSNRPTRKSDELELQKLSNDALVARNEYNIALQEYNQSAQELQLEVLRYRFALSQAEAEEEYCRLVYEQEKRLFDEGLSTRTNLNDALFAYEEAKASRLNNALDGKALEVKIRLLNI